MDTMYRCCAGLDVHKKTVAACVRRVDAAGRVTQEVRIGIPSPTPSRRYAASPAQPRDSAGSGKCATHRNDTG